MLLWLAKRQNQFGYIFKRIFGIPRERFRIWLIFIIFSLDDLKNLDIMLCEKNQIQMVSAEATSHGYVFPTPQNFFSGLVNHFGFFLVGFWHQVSLRVQICQESRFVKICHWKANVFQNCEFSTFAFYTLPNFDPKRKYAATKINWVWFFLF